MSDWLSKMYAHDSTISLQIQKQGIDKIHDILTSNAIEVGASQKFYTLKVLNKIVGKKNIQLNLYIVDKLMP